MSARILATALTLAFGVAHAQDEPSGSQFDWSLRSGEEPPLSARPWDRGAAIAYRNVNGRSTTQVDAVLQAEWLLAPTRLGPTPESGAYQWTLSPGAYLHRNNASADRQDDRGVSFTAAVHIAPPRASGAGAVFNIDSGLSVSRGRTLMPAEAAGARDYFDVDSQRGLLFGSFYLQPGKGEFRPESNGQVRPSPVFYVRASANLYVDRASGSEDALANGSLRGATFGAQLSIAPFGLDPALNPVGTLGFAPVITFAAQAQRDATASGQRQKDSRKLYSATLSIPFANNAGREGPVPSLDLQRSVGADLLQGRPYKRETRLTFSLKF